MGREVCVPHVPSANQTLIIVSPQAMLNHTGFLSNVQAVEDAWWCMTDVLLLVVRYREYPFWYYIIRVNKDILIIIYWRIIATNNYTH